jgi:hypothetical protein
MIEHAETDVAEIGIRLLDDAYLAWLGAESESELALHAWFERNRSDPKTAYFAYLAALDREEAAARDLQRLSAVTESCPGSLVQGTVSVKASTHGSTV